MDPRGGLDASTPPGVRRQGLSPSEHAVPGPGITTLLCFCSVQNKLLSKDLSHTQPPSSPSCLPSPDPAAATSSPSAVDSVSPARKVVVPNHQLPPLPTCSETPRSARPAQPAELRRAQMEIRKILPNGPQFGSSFGLDPATSQNQAALKNSSKAAHSSSKL